MLNLSLAQCLKATQGGVFDSRKLDLVTPLSLEDLAFLTEYLRATSIHSLTLALEIDDQLSQGLEKLTEVIASKSDLVKFHFTIEELYFENLFPEGHLLLSFVDNYRRKALNNKIVDNVVHMLNNKSSLTDIQIDLSALTQPLSMEQTGGLTWRIGKSPIKSLKLNFEIEPGSRLPIVDRTKPNHQLNRVEINGTIYGHNVLMYLANTTELKELLLSQLELHLSDLAFLATILKNNPNLTYLSLNQLNIGQFDSNLLFDQLKNCANLLILDLSQCDLSCFNVDLLCEYLSSNQCRLNELDLSQNTYLGTDFKKIATALYGTRTLEKLIVDNNYIESEGLRELIKLCSYNRNITRLMISGICRFQPSDEVIDELVTFLISPECQLQEFYFHQALSNEQLLKVSQAILKNKSLNHVYLDYPSTVLGSICRQQIRIRFNGDFNGIESSSEAQEDILTEDDELVSNSVETEEDEFHSALDWDEEAEEESDSVSVSP